MLKGGQTFRETADFHFFSTVFCFQHLLPLACSARLPRSSFDPPLQAAAGANEGGSHRQSTIKRVLKKSPEKKGGGRDRDLKRDTELSPLSLSVQRRGRKSCWIMAVPSPSSDRATLVHFQCFYFQTKGRNSLPLLLCGVSKSGMAVPLCSSERSSKRKKGGLNVTTSP